MIELTWMCMVCKEKRPDAQISVHKKPLVIEGMDMGHQNIRYCNDRPACFEGAKEYDFTKAPKGA